jgi:hypothetical protein
MSVDGGVSLELGFVGFFWSFPKINFYSMARPDKSTKNIQLFVIEIRLLTPIIKMNKPKEIQ